MSHCDELFGEGLPLRTLDNNVAEEKNLHHLAKES
jgi:hypothetical protein